MIKNILISTVMLLLLAGLAYSQDIQNDVKYESVTDEGIYNPPYNPDWANNDILVYDHSGGTANITDRTLDMEYCEENGRLYIAACVNTGSTHGIRVWSSSNSGLTWDFEDALASGSHWFTGLSMKVEQYYPGRPDSVRVNIFYTRSAGSPNNDNAILRFWSFKPHASSPSGITRNVGTPSAGNQLRWPSAYSNGQYNSAGTDIGCIVGEYNNAGTDCITFRKFWMNNWDWNFSGTIYAAGPYFTGFWPSADYKNDPSTNYDSVYIAFESRWPTVCQIRLSITRAFGGGDLTSGRIIVNIPGWYARRPCLTIPQNRYPTRMVITYTFNPFSYSTTGIARKIHSYNGGVSWTNGYLGNDGSYTSRYTWVSSDSNGNSGYCTYIWGNADSLNVTRGSVAATGTLWYARASNLVTNGAFPICAVYNNSSGNHRRSTFVYWKSGPADIYFNAEHLPIGITNTNGIANTYSLSQNFPNPFNPITTIKFSIPQRGLVKLVVFDVLGKEVATLVNNEQTTGNYEVTFNASKLTSGVYFYKITSGDFSDVKKMLLVK